MRWGSCCIKTKFIYISVFLYSWFRQKKLPRISISQYLKNFGHRFHRLRFFLQKTGFIILYYTKALSPWLRVAWQKNKKVHHRHSYNIHANKQGPFFLFQHSFPPPKSFLIFLRSTFFNIFAKLFALSMFGGEVYNVFAPTFWRQRFGANVLTPRFWRRDVRAPRCFSAEIF